MRASTVPLLLACALAFPTGTAAAQRVLGPGPDAVTLPRGILRTTLGGDHTLHRERWNDGQREPLGSGFSVPALGAPHMAALRALDEQFAALGVSGLNASLGQTRLDLRQRVFVTRFGVEYGLTDRITFGVEVPLVRTRAEAQLRARGDSGLASAGVNPYFLGAGVPASNRTTVDAYSQASLSLTQRRDDCIADPGSAPECPEILAEAAQVDALIAAGAQFATLLAQTYGAQGLPGGLPYVPLVGSPGEVALRQRAAQFGEDFTRYGVTDITPTTGLPLAAQTPLSAEQLEAMVATVYGARPMTRTARTSLGDVDVGLRVKLFDTFAAGDTMRYGAARIGFRQTLGATYRFGNGVPDVPDNFIDVGTGPGHDALVLRSFTDVVVNDRLWTSITLGWVRGTPFTRAVRVPSSAHVEWLEPWREQLLAVSPGRMIELEVAPRWQLNEYLALGATWRARDRDADDTSMSDVAALDGYGHSEFLVTGPLDSRSAWTEQRIGLTFAYSSVAAVARGRARLPMEIAFTHEESVASSGGILPRRFEDRVQVRVYTRLFGR
ncbi:MAG: hypothetical protein WD771_06300 [Gemmatimonadaceae bacterium]